jgi:hypothetical protein
LSEQRFAPVAPAPSLGTVDLPRLSPADVGSLFRELEAATKQLKNAVNTDIRYTLRGNAQANCGNAGCLVSVRVNGSVATTGPDTRVTGGRVNGQLVATVQIDGQPAGGCTATATLPVNGPGVISCQNPAAGAVFTTVQARKRAIAAAQSRAQGGRPVPYTILITGEAEVVAIATVQVEVLVRLLRLRAELAQELARAQEQQQRPSPSTSPSPGRATPSATQPTAAPTPRQSGQPSPSPVPFPTPPRADCTASPPAGAQVRPGGSWIVNTSGPSGRAGRGSACLKAPLAKNATSPRVLPVGMAHAWAIATRAGAPTSTVARCHIVGAQLGGANDRQDNLVPCWQSGVNVADVTNPQGMTGFEGRAAQRISSRPAETMEYVVDPVYRSGASTVPFMFTMLAITFAPDGAVTSVDFHQLANERVVNRRVVNLGN